MRISIKSLYNRFGNADAIYGLTLCFAFLILYFILIPAQVEVYPTEEAVQADFFPKLLTLMLICFSALLLAVGVKRGKDKRGKAKDAGLRSGKKGAWIRVGIISLAFIVYLGIFTPVGFIVSSLAFLLFSMNYYGSRNWIMNILLSVIFVSGLYFVFRWILHVDLPLGILGF